MQKTYAWLRPRHYYLYFGSRRRFNISGLLNVAVVLSIVGSSLALGRGFTRPSITTASSAPTIQQPVVIVPPPAPAAPQSVKPISNYPAVAAAVQQWLKLHSSSQWGVVLQDLQTADNNVHFNADTSFDSASLYKLFLTIPLAQKLPFSSWSGQHTLNGDGDRSYAECVQAMLAVSDNTCGEAIGDYVGWSKATKVLHTDGFTHTSLGIAPIQTTASDVASYLVGLEQGKWFDAATRGFILDSLSAQKFRAGIPAGCSGCTVFNKTGLLNGVTHDAAIITSGQQHFVLVIMSKGGNYAQIADLTKLINATLL